MQDEKILTYEQAISVMNKARIDTAKEIAKRAHSRFNDPDNGDMPINYIPGAIENMIDDYIHELEKEG